MKHIKYVVISDGAVGKNILLIIYTTGEYQDEYFPPVYDYYFANVMFEDQFINLQLWDTDGQEDYKKLRPLLFFIASPTSLEYVENLWIPEITEHWPGTPYIHVGFKSPLCDEFHLHEDEYKSKGWGPVSTTMGEKMKRKICAVDYIYI